MTRWYFGLDARAIREGLHPDFHRGQQAEFTVEFSMPACEAVDGGVPAAHRAGDCRYDVVARVVAVAAESWVLDCGILVHGRVPDPSPEVAVGAWLAGEARLGVGPAAAEPGVPDDGAALVRSWYVERVHHRVDVEEEMLDPRLAMLEPVEAGWEELAFTSAFQDDDGQATYLLECALVEW